MKVLFCWSGGKDSAFALYRLLQNKQYEVVGLLTTINKNHMRVSMHGVHQTLIEEQAKAIGLPLDVVYISEATNAEYEQNMKEKLLTYKQQDVTHVAFGDIFLEDLKQYREKQCATVGLECIFPLWKENTKTLVHDFVALGFKTMMCCVNEQLGEKFAGKVLNNDVIKSLPNNIDPCGENGEFHTFVFEGPIFKYPITVKNNGVLEKVYEWRNESGNTEKSTFFFADIVSC
jgi:uncharacterized protein (TIGR00290 family)